MNKQLNGRYIDNIGRVVMTSDGLCDFIMKGKSINGLLVEECEDTIKYNKLCNNSLNIYSNNIANESLELFDTKATSQWKTPKKYKITDEELITWLLEQCSDENEYDRVLLELNMYEERGLYPLLKHLIYLVDHFRKNNIVWGVGRGSSVASFILYLIGIHRVHALKFNLDINDFLK